MTRSATLVHALALLGVAWALPAQQQPDQPIGPCDSSAPSTQSVSYVNNSDPPTVNGTAIVGGLTCPAYQDCTPGISESYQVGTTITENTSFGIDIDDAFSAGFDVSVSESMSTAVQESDTLTCPTGDYTCALVIYPQLAQISGTQTITETDPCSGDTTPGSGGGPYGFTSPLTDGEGNAAIYAALCACPNFSGADNLPANIGLCPSDCS